MPKFAMACAALVFLAASARAQDQRSEEVVANLAEGRVVICVARDGMDIAAVSGKGEPGSHAPAVVPLSSDHIGILLGAIDWVTPDSGAKPVRLDGELQRLAAQVNQRGPGVRQSGGETNDIEALGVALLERIRQLAGQIHSELKLGENEPLVRMLYVGFAPDYGPEVWTIDYRVEQESVGDNYWVTRVPRPRYNQLYPPEKGRPHTLMEVAYPPETGDAAPPDLLALLRSSDPRLLRIRDANEPFRVAVGRILDGQSQKSDADVDADFLRTALPVVSDPNAKLSLATFYSEKGFHWVLAPAEQLPADSKPREADAPTLRKKGS